MEKLHHYRRLSQLLMGAILILMPFLDIFRLDVPSKAFIILGKPLPTQEAYLFLIGVIIATLLFVGLVKIAGRVPCGWLCPRNASSELMDRLVPKGKNPLLAKVVKGAATAFFLLLLALVNAAYFFDWRQILGDLFMGKFTMGNIFFLGMVAVVSFDQIWVRHLFCRYACPYGMLQMLLADQRSLRVQWKEANAGDCIDCGACARSCFMEVDPRTDEVNSCVNCGDCVAACSQVADKRGVLSSLHFAFGGTRAFGWKDVLADRRFVLLAGLLLVLSSVFTYGMLQRQGVYAVLSQNKTSSGYVTVVGDSAISYFFVNITNDLSQVSTFALGQQGLPEGAVTYGQNPVTVGPGQTTQVGVIVRVKKDEVPAGPHDFVVTVERGGAPVATTKGVFFMPTM